jgi:hypothetical protein
VASGTRTRQDARTSLTPLHRAAAIICCVVLPGLSWLGASGALAWTMFSTSETYRIRLEVTSADGHKRLVNPTALAQYTSVDVGSYLSGAESWRHGPAGDAFRRQLHALCLLACRLREEPQRADLQLETRKTPDAAVLVSRVACACPSSIPNDRGHP